MWKVLLRSTGKFGGSCFLSTRVLGRRTAPKQRLRKRYTCPKFGKCTDSTMLILLKKRIASRLLGWLMRAWRGRLICSIWPTWALKSTSFSSAYSHTTRSGWAIYPQDRKWPNSSTNLGPSRKKKAATWTCSLIHSKCISLKPTSSESSTEDLFRIPTIFYLKVTRSSSSLNLSTITNSHNILSQPSNMPTRNSASRKATSMFFRSWIWYFPNAPL